MHTRSALPACVLTLAAFTLAALGPARAAVVVVTDGRITAVQVRSASGTQIPAVGRLEAVSFVMKGGELILRR